MAWRLCTKQDVATLHNIDVTTLRDSWSELVEELISEHMGSPALPADVTYTETLNGDGTNVIAVRRPPIKSVTSIKFSGSSVAASEYEVGTHKVSLLYTRLPVGVKNIEIVYVSGIEDNEVPASVRLAAITMISAIVNHYKKFGAGASIKWSDVEDQLSATTPTANIGLISHLKGIMVSILRRNKVKIK